MSRKLKGRIRLSTELFLGGVKPTLFSWIPAARIGFVAFDLDYYSSTKNAFTLFERSSEAFLPRIYCYFDDIIWPEHALHNEWVGELCVIREFSEEHTSRKLCTDSHVFQYACSLIPLEPADVCSS